MKIKGLNGRSIEDVRKEVDKGAKFIFFTYCISLIVVTSRRSSDIYFVRAGESSIKYGWPFFLSSFFMGWWGIPWGPIYTIGALYNAFVGKNVTLDVMQEFDLEHARNNPITSWDNYNQPN
jgi:hypothetical protein